MARTVYEVVSRLFVLLGSSNYLAVCVSVQAGWRGMEYYHHDGVLFFSIFQDTPERDKFVKGKYRWHSMK